MASFVPSSTASSPTSFLASKLGSNPTQATTQAVGQFKNQTVGALNTGLSPIAGANVVDTGKADPNGAPVKTANQQALDAQMAAIGGGDSHNRQMALLTQAKANNDAAAAKAAEAANAAKANQVSAPIAGTSTANVAGATGYTNDGNLDAARNQVLSTASSYLGTPYQLGGTSHQAIDCSGLVMAVYAQMGFTNLPHNARIQGQIMGQRTSVSNLRPGDLVAWNDGSHIAIYAGNGQIIEAANPRVGTVRRQLWSSAVYGVRLRLPGE